MPSPDLFDVAIVGYGPVSAVLAAVLGRQGRRVAIFERWTERYPLPRAVCIDHEIYRVLSAIGMGEDLPAVSHAGPAYRWFNAEWRELLSIDWAAESRSGGPEVSFIHQPTLEAVFDAHVRALPTVELNLGCEVVAVEQDEARAGLTVVDRNTDERRTVSASYVVGCDGANSLVRQAIGGDQEDRGFEADWLVIDVLPNAGVELDIPAAAQWCNPLRPTTIVPAGVRDGQFFRRWEFMRLPHETVQDLENERKAWALLAPWVRPDQAILVRHKVYTFRSLLAGRWRNGRLLIAGDAAHVMPPFMGQGMCSGLRDDWNLAWKLDLVLDGRADPALLDSYQVERAPHVSDVIDLSMFLGRMICQPDAARAAERDALFLSGAAPAPPAFPHLTAGLLNRPTEEVADPVAGLLSPHSRVRQAGRELRLDEASGGGFVMVARDSAVLNALSAPTLELAAELGVTLLSLGGESDDPRAWTDVDGRVAAFLADHGLAAMLVRPDFYVFGGAADAWAAQALVVRLDQAIPRSLAPRRSVAA